MEILEKKILLEDFIDRRTYGSDGKLNTEWGKISADTFYINVMITQSMDNMGIFSDIEYFPKTNISSPPDYTILKDKLNVLNIVNFGFMAGKTVNINPYNLTNKEILRIPQIPLSGYTNYPAITCNLKI